MVCNSWKADYPVKKYYTSGWQAVVDAFPDLTFIQIGQQPDNRNHFTGYLTGPIMTTTPGNRFPGAAMLTKRQLIEALRSGRAPLSADADAG